MQFVDVIRYFCSGSEPLLFRKLCTKHPFVYKGWVGGFFLY